MKRNLSLDILRGITIFAMILVNNPGPGGALGLLQHNEWDGCSVADMVFPFFIFIVGASMFFAFKRVDFKLDGALTVKIIKRSALIFLIGYLLNALWFDRAIPDIRIMAALQRIAIVYLLASFAVLWIKKINLIAMFTGGLLLLYWAIVHLTDSYTLVNNTIAQIDQTILGESRMYHIAGVSFDPEGLVGTISSMCNALIGFMMAWLLVNRGWRQILWAGVAMVVVALAWDILFPINKPLWSSSFVLYTCGWISIIWAVLYFIVDVKDKRSWGTFFVVLGSNAIFAYIVSQVLSSLNWSFEFSLSGWLFDNVYGPVMAGWLASLCWSIIVVGVSWLLTYALYRKKIFLKL